MKMKSEENDLLEMLQKNREIELTNVKMVQEKEEQFKSAGVRLTLYQIRTDSAKHAQIYQTLIDLIKEGTTKYLWDYRIDRYVGQIATDRVLQEHVELENEMIRGTEEALRRTDDPGMKLMLQHIVDDEKRHHKMLMDVIKRLLQLGP